MNWICCYGAAAPEKSLNKMGSSSFCVGQLASFTRFGCGHGNPRPNGRISPRKFSRDPMGPRVRGTVGLPLRLRVASVSFCVPHWGVGRWPRSTFCGMVHRTMQYGEFPTPPSLRFTSPPTHTSPFPPCGVTSSPSWGWTLL